MFLILMGGDKMANMCVPQKKETNTGKEKRGG